MKELDEYVAIRAPCMGDISGTIPTNHLAGDRRIGHLTGIRYLHRTSR
jgi:hypothetical protein